MKKPVGILVLVTGVFAAFVAGFFAGRNLNRTPVRIYQAPAPTALPAEETAPEEPVVPTSPAAVNINTATAQQLEALPGVGPVLAQRIVDYRTVHGLFQTPEELSKVKGIGESKLKELLDFVTVGG